MKTKNDPISRRRLWPQSRSVCLGKRLFLMLFLLISAVTGVKADAYITDLVVLGEYYESDINTLKTQYTNNGWTVVNTDLNSGAGSNSYYVYLAYKTSGSANPETGYVTDIVASTSSKNTLTYDNRTYSKVPTNSGFNGDLNKGASGAYIYLYYTRERTGLSGNGGQQRVIKSISTSNSSTNTSIQWAEGNSGAVDANKGASGSHIYMNMSFGTQTLTVSTHPTFVSNFTYDGASHLLVPNAPTGNYGTMMYKVNNGSWSSSLPSAKNVGNYTVYYRLEAYYANNSTEYSKTITINPPITKPSSLKGGFNQELKQITLTWNVGSLAGNYTDYKWTVYRGGVRIATLAQNVRSYTDTTYPIDSSVDYEVYYVSNFWDIGTKRNDTKATVTVDAKRKVPVDNFNVVSKADRLVFTWTSTDFPAGWGNKFNIYVDNETDPVYTIVPTDRQTNFQWEHRTTDQHNDRQNKTYTVTENGVTRTIPYTEEPLNGCGPHNYRIEGVIGDVVLNTATANNKAIGSGTLFYDFDATKGVYPGTVKLSWHVDLQGSTAAKTYIIDRRRTEKEDEAWVTLYRTSSADEYLFYTDETPLPGVYYDYRVIVQDKCSNGSIITNDTTDIGFAQTTGTVSGRITYGTTGMAVGGADVMAEKTNSSGGNLNQFYAMRFTSYQGLVTWKYPDNNYAKKFNSGDFSMQMWISPEEFSDKWIARLQGENKGALGMSSSGELLFCDGGAQYSLGVTLTAGVYNHVVLTRSGKTVTAYVVDHDANGKVILRKGSANFTNTMNFSGATQFTLGNFKGYVDEFRLWTKCLTEDEIKENYDHLLVGNEKDLETYWTFDEGLRTQFFDYSRDGTVYHEHHGKIGEYAEAVTFTPADLALKAKTDKDGNYILQGVPFTGEGTTYAIIPSMGAHKFNPQQQLRYVGNNSLVHNGVDFDDVSSFKVTGTVYYEHTSIPVPEAYLYIDGVMASKDGEPIMTNDDGGYEISVPIGDHFIQVKKSGHTFVNDGRYPEDPDGLGNRRTFEEDIPDLTFYDKTLVTVAGRVAGGDLEFEKPLGLGQGKNNIGVATLQLTMSSPKGYLNVKEPDPDETTTSVSISDKDRTFDAVAGSAKVPGGKNYITIQTDAATGEWVAMLPPLRYDVTDVSFASRPADQTISKQDFSLPVIDATNPNVSYTDSITVDGVVKTFEYNASAKMEYKAESTIDVTENKNGTFGIKNYKVKDINGVEHEVKMYDYDDTTGNVNLDANGNVKYTFGVTDQNPNGYPVYLELSSYKYTLYAYERYTNYDGANPVVDEVPLAGKTVTIKNQYASTTSVKTGENEFGDVYEVMDDQLELDDNGKAIYQFTAGFPNIQDPYTRGLSISYDNNGTEKSWSGNNKFKVIVLGGLPTGNNFVTKGPNEVLMVLRDPPGTGSQTTWSKGTTVSHTTTTSSEYNNSTGINTTWYLGVETKTGAGVGFMVIQDLESKCNIKAGAEYTATRTSGNTTVKTTTTTRDISTSDAMDFVGANGDVFIGYSKNLIFGASHVVDIKWDNVTGKPNLVQEDAMSIGEEFETSFAYDQNYIKNVLIPNLEDLRNSLLTPVASVSGVARPDKGTKDPIYVTTLSKDDPNYGTSNNDEVWGSRAVEFETLSNGVYSGPSYTMLLPIDYEKDLDGVQDMVYFYNEQISKWEEELSANEEAKVKAMGDRKKYLQENQSFSAGASVTQSVTNENSETDVTSKSDGFNIVLGLETGFRFSGLGLGGEVTESNGGTWTSEESDETVESATMSYTLAEDGDDDYLSVDVYRAPDGFGPIFVTRGGATSCPYEDEVVTEYFQKGTVISKKTVQIEKPEIEAQTQIITGIPAGGIGTFKVNIRNNSDTGEDLWFDLLVTPDSNPDGLAVSMDDTSLNYGTTVLVKAGETMEKTITVSQSNPDVLRYENVKIRIASQCQRDNTSTYPEIADTTEFSAFFQPSCSDIKLETSHTLVNTETESFVTLSMSGYNYSMASLKGVRLQYKGINDADFRTLQEYTKDASRLASDPNLRELVPLEGTAKLNYVVDLRSTNFSDKTYVFRAVTVCDQGGVEVNNESDEITIIRDMARPQLIATPSPASGILTSSDDLLITFNEDIQGSILRQPDNFDVVGVLNESEVSHDVALSLTGENAAKTESTMELSGKSFAASMWVNYSSDGTLLMHGTADNNFTVAIEGGKLAVSVAGEKLTTTESLPTNKWLYLNVAYDAEAETVSAGYAMDASTVIIMNNRAAKAYEGNGPLTIGGNNLTAKVQELSIWNSARTMAQAQSTMYTTKSQYTSGLIGYWQLNEGHGDVATDRARSRNLTLPSQNAWWINGANYALVLNGTKVPAVNISSLNTTDGEDYLVETWFKANEQQDGVVTVMSTPKMDLRLNGEGKMDIVLNGDNTAAGYANNPSTLVYDKDLRDGQWHHVALNVLKSTNGSGIIYVDGQQRKQIAASDMPELFGESLMLGGRRVEKSYGVYNYAQLMKGAVDEVRIWKGRRTADVIKNNMYVRAKADEAGLVAYYPLEKNTRDAYNQIVATGTFNDVVTAGSASPAVLSFYGTNGGSVSSASSDLSTVNTAALKQMPKMENVRFSFVASERQIKVNLEEQPAKVEGCNISITVKNVMDMNNNTAEAITWSVYVQQNKLRWQEADMVVNKTGAEAAQFTATIENCGSESESWSLSGMPTWLSANVEGGSLMPLTSAKLTFTVAAGLPIGTYETTVYLTGSQNIAAPLNITVTSEGEAPDWVATPGENTMTIIGVLNIDGVQSSDPKDMVAAFRGTECVGVAQPKYFSRYDSYMILMTVYGKGEADLTYKAYDASTGTVYPSVSVDNAQAYKFGSDKAIGTFTQPATFIPLNEIEQDLSHDRASWKWFSLYAKPKTNSISVVFKDAHDAIATVTDGDNTLMNWVGNLQSFSYNKMYKLEANAPYVESLIGEPVNPTETAITLKGSGWTWIGYPCQSSNTLDAAFASANPQEGDMVKNQSDFALFTEGEWIGTLGAMQPGDGYMYSSNATATKTFNFPKPAVSGRVNAPRRAPSVQSSVFAGQWKDNMTMIAVVMNGDEVVENAQVSVFANTELRGYSAETVRDGRHFLTIGGQGGQTDILTFVVETEDEVFSLPYYEVFVADAQRGSMAQPVVLQLSEATGIDNQWTNGQMAVKSILLFDGSGRLIRTTDHPVRLYTEKDLQSMPAGVYYQQVIYQNGQNRVIKVMR